MREILFRGKRKDTDEWVEGTSLDSHHIGIFYDDTEEKDCEVHIFPVISETVGQYIGLNDKNGKKIFEGDILESPVKRIGAKLGNLIVVTDIRGCWYMALYAIEYSVIGNVHDNPELLEGGEE